MRLLRRRGMRPDAGTPPLLGAPRHALLRPLAFATGGLRDRGTMRVEVLPFGAAPRTATLRSGLRPSGFAGMVVGSTYPALLDDDEPRTVLLVEPTCGHRLPVPQPAFQALWPARDARTRQLRDACPAPSPSELQTLLAAADAPADPQLAALLARMRLMTTAEAAAVSERIRADGVRWEDAVTRFDVAAPLDLDGATEVAGALSHLRDVDGAPPLDPQPLIAIGGAVRWRHLARDAVAASDDVEVAPSADDLRTVVEPFARVCGPLAL